MEKPLAMCKVVLALLVIVLLSIPALAVMSANPDAKRLYDDLLSKYNRLIRPVGNNSEKITVKMGLKLSQLIDLNLKNQIMTTNVWVEQVWHDYKLQWEPEEYGGVQELFVPSELLWLPDIVLYNNADGSYVVTTMTKAVLNYDGTVVWKPPAIFKSSCEIDVEYFPFDQQECFMKFGSWTYDGYMIDLTHTAASKEQTLVNVGIDLREYYLSVEWDIMAVPAKKNEKFYSCCEEPYPDITFTITLRRKTLFYTVNLIIPCIGISYLSVLVFYLPVDSGEKVVLCISILLSLVMYLLLITEIMPSTSLAVPLLGKYLLFTMILVGFSVVLTSIVLNVHFRSPTTHRMAPWVRRVFIGLLPRFLCIRRPNANLNEDVNPPPPPPPRSRPPRHLGPIPDNRMSLMAYNIRGDGDSDILPYVPRHYPQDVERAIVNLRFIAQRMNNQDEYEKIAQDWKYVAMVMDRLFLVLFGIATLGGTFGIILQAPALYDDTQPIDVQVTQVTSTILPDI
uniref:Uncharacterized protein n=1 Tax=Strigamia maritima TaxID=126957 RepID=T1IUC4_STRMM